MEGLPPVLPSYNVGINNILENRGMDLKVGSDMHGETIKNALKWRKLDISTFISKKVVNFSTKHYIDLKMTNNICFM